MKYVVTIDRLVLDGLGASAGRTAEIEQLIAHELGELLAEEGFLRDRIHDSRVARVEGGTIDVAMETHTDRKIGRQIARSIFGGIRNGGENRSSSEI